MSVFREARAMSERGGARLAPVVTHWNDRTAATDKRHFHSCGNNWDLWDTGSPNSAKTRVPMFHGMYLPLLTDLPLLEYWTTYE